MHFKITLFSGPYQGIMQMMEKTMYLKEWDPRGKEQIQKDLLRVHVLILEGGSMIHNVVIYDGEYKLLILLFN
jgi:hypothetical protein